MTSQQLTDFNDKSRCMDLFTPGEMPMRGAKKKAPANLNRGQAPMVSSPTNNNNQQQQQQKSAVAAQYKHVHPMLTGSFNGWEEPQRMLPVREFTHFIDRKKPELFAELRKR